MSRLTIDPRSLPSLVGDPGPLDPDAAPADPIALFAIWFEEAVSAGAPEPHALTLSTVDTEGRPDARVLILKDVTDDGSFSFAGDGRSVKGRQLGTRPAAALTFWWSSLVRSVRIRGPVEPAGNDLSAADFAARSISARAVAAAGPTSSPLASTAVQQRAVDRARRSLEEDEPVDTNWTLWLLRPVQIEFWQGQPSRQHTRIQYNQTPGSWSHQLLWS